MTLANTASQTTASGNGLTTVFSYSFPMPTTDSAVLVYTDTTGSTSSISSSLFSITGVGPTSSGGTFTYPLSGTPSATGTTLTLMRTVPLVQDAAISNLGTFAPQVTENELDYQMMALQQMQRQIDDLAARVTALGG